jgi:hypothetical protein
MDSFSASETYSVYTYWRDEPAVDSYEEEMRIQLEKIAQQQKAAKSSAKTKGSTTPTSSVPPKTTSTSSVPPKTTPIVAVTKPGGEKLLTLAQATENTVKRA